MWNVIFLAAPLHLPVYGNRARVGLFRGTSTKHSFPFLVANELAFMVGLWGMLAWQGQCLYLALFPSNFKALVTVLQGRKSAFR